MDNQTQSVAKAKSTDAAITNPTATSSEQTKKPYRRTWKKLILIYLLTGAVIYAGVYYFVLSKQNSKSYSQPVSKTVANLTAAADPTANWKTYTNIEYGYSFQYPLEWKLSNKNTENPNIREFIELSDSKGGNRGSVSLVTTLTENHLLCNPDIQKSTCENILVDGKPTKINWKGYGYIEANIDMKKDQITKVVFYQPHEISSSEKEFFKAFLQTFKFTNQNVFEGQDSYNPKIKFTLNIPESCTKGKQGRQGVMPNADNIKCNDITIIPGAGAHGMGEGPSIQITAQTDDIVLSGYEWKRSVLSSNTAPSNDKTAIYTLQGNVYLLMEVDYSNYSKEDQDLVESILSSFKFTK